MWSTDAVAGLLAAELGGALLDEGERRLDVILGRHRSDHVRRLGVERGREIDVQDGILAHVSDVPHHVGGARPVGVDVCLAPPVGDAAVDGDPVPDAIPPLVQAFLEKGVVGILDGDYVVVRQQNTASNGDIVVALLEVVAGVGAAALLALLGNNGRGLGHLEQAMLTAGRLEKLELPALDADRRPVFAGGVAVNVDALVENDFQVLASQVEEAVTSRTKSLLLGYPNNPTGTVVSRDTLKSWVDYARRNRSIILYDAAYEAFVQDTGLPRSIYEVDGAREVGSRP